MKNNIEENNGVNIGKLCMCEETDIESVLAAMNTTALVFERRPAKNFKPHGIWTPQ